MPALCVLPGATSTDPASSNGEKMKKTYRVSLSWTLCGHVYVDAESQEEAIDYAIGPKCPLPDGEYLDESARVDGVTQVSFDDLDEVECFVCGAVGFDY